MFGGLHFKSPNIKLPQARRILSRNPYEKKAERMKGGTQKKDIYVKIVKLVEENMAERE